MLQPSVAASAPIEKHRIQRLSDLTGAEWRTGIAAWLGWTFDGLDTHLYTLVAAPFVAQLLHVASTSDPAVKEKSAWIQAAFLIGWALGGAFFGRIGDIIGRSHTLGLTILSYAIFTGLAFFAATWWQLLIFRFLAALGIGGEWAVGASLLSETWPRKWQMWVSAFLQTGVNVGVLVACLSVYLIADVPERWVSAVSGQLPGYLHDGVINRCVFLIGILPALVVFWIRRSVGEPQEWHDARLSVQKPPRWTELFQGAVRRTTILTIIVCSFSLTAWWAFLFWNVQQLRSLPELATWSDSEKARLISSAFFLVIGVSIPGNFFAAFLAKLFGYRRAIALMCVGFCATMFGAYCVPRGYASVLHWIPWVGFFSGVFALFTMYLPPLFPVLLRTTGAGFSYNIGRIAAAIGTVVFGLFATVHDFRIVLMWDAFLFIPAMFVVLMMPEGNARTDA
jgi:MFS family permease